MGTSDRGGVYPAMTMAMAIPIDLFVSKKHFSNLGLPRGELGFCDSSGNLLFSVSESSSQCKRRRLLLLDAAREALLSMERDLKSKRSWKVFKEKDGVEKELICTVEGRRSSLKGIEFDVLFLSGEIEDEINCSSSTSSSIGPIPPSYKMKGFPFQRSCTIYKGNSIVAQTSLMYKLHQIYAKKSKFRITLYPTCNDTSLIVALEHSPSGSTAVSRLLQIQLPTFQYVQPISPISTAHQYFVTPSSCEAHTLSLLL